MIAPLFALFVTAAELPLHYERLLEAGSAKVQARLDAERNADLEALEAVPGGRQIRCEFRADRAFQRHRRHLHLYEWTLP
ncbi:MAG: hypothetical protein U0Q16_03015 [Bryobacteraceae bacterium]